MLCLTVDEIIFITGKKRRPAQTRALRFMGIEHKTRPDGTLLISRTHVEKLLDGDSVKSRIERRIEPNWSAIDAKSS